MGVLGGRDLAELKQASQVIETKSAKQTGRSQKDLLQTILTILAKQFLVPHFCGIFWKSCRKPSN